MQGHILLAGGSEFGGGMALPDRQAMMLAGGPDAPIRIIPAAAAPDRNDRRAGRNGVRWFQSLGATNVSVVPLIDQASAAAPAIAAELRTARLVYLLGGFTHYLGQTLAGSAGWDAVLAAYHSGAVIAGSSAGAMVLCDWYFDPERGQVEQGLGLVPGTLVLPHHNIFGQRWAPRLSAARPDLLLLGIDERTGMIDDAPGGGWTVYGGGAVTLYRSGQTTVYQAGEQVRLVQAGIP